MRNYFFKLSQIFLLKTQQKIVIDIDITKLFVDQSEVNAG